MIFPKKFLWGAATSSHQVEGNNTNNDWWLWERQGRTQDPSGKAANHYELFEQDFQLARDLTHNAHRFSIEWSRVEPQEGVFSNAAIEHYRAVIRSLRQKDIEPIVTLHHFTNPQWFSQQQGWLNHRSGFWFARYCARVMEALGRDVQYWITINEPMVLVYHAYLIGLWPPGKKSFLKMWQAANRLMNAHKAAYRTIRGIYRQHQWPVPKISIAQNLRPFKPCPRFKNIFVDVSIFIRHRLFNWYFLHKIRNHVDFIGVNYYDREYVSNETSLGCGLWGGRCNHAHGHAGHVNMLGWDSWPEGLFEVLSWLKGFRKPILITENGTCEEDDNFRRQFIEEHLKELQRALNAGVPVIGYLYWSLLDNFEWHHGFGPRFGLVEVDYTTFKRTVRPSALRFRDMIK